MNTIDKRSAQNVQPERLLSPRGSAVSPHPVDGSQFHNVIEEQVYSELPPTLEEQMPRRARHLSEPEGQQVHPDGPAISVGTP